jgi:hypothetical protein
MKLAHVVDENAHGVTARGGQIDVSD